MSKPVLVITEQRNNNFRKASFEAISEGKRLADKLNSEVIALVFGNQPAAGIEKLSVYGASKILIAESELFRNYSAEGYLNVIMDVVKQNNPGVILIPASSTGKDIAPRIAGKLGVGLASDCIKVDIANGKLIAKRPMYAGKVLVDCEFDCEPQMATLRPNIFTAQEISAPKPATIEKIAVATSSHDLKAVVKEVVASAGAKIDLTEANIIVSGGRGMKSAENFAILEKMADILGGVVGASRAAVDAGWRTHADQVGQTGKTVSPNLYIACGISGSIQHFAGMGSSKCIVAINKDSAAPIFERADYGIVGDLFEVVPVLTEELKKVLGK
jgi:electron transfer flavoprotein alpha subunit